MEVVIPKNETQGHIINRYKFKVLGNGAPEKSRNEAAKKKREAVETPAEEPAGELMPQGDIMTGSKDALVNSLLQKTDEMSSNFIKLQMKLEAAEEEHKSALEAARAEAFEAGLQEGRSQLSKEREEASANGMEQYAVSVKTLEGAAQTFEQALSGIREELIHAALDIAKEVVSSEVSEHSSAIASRLAGELIKELQSASKVTLKVNPKDHGVISEKVGTMAHVEVLSDSAVRPGGVIAISDAGNIDAEIMKRYERAKRAALAE